MPRYSNKPPIHSIGEIITIVDYRYAEPWLGMVVGEPDTTEDGESCIDVVIFNVQVKENEYFDYCTTVEYNPNDKKWEVQDGELFDMGPQLNKRKYAYKL